MEKKIQSTDDPQNEKLVQANKKLKRALQLVKNQILGAMRDQPGIFDGIGEDSNERLNHLISTIGNQAAQIDALHVERQQVEEQLKNENRELQR